MRRKEKLVRGGIASEHIVQFFDSRESLADAVARYLAEGCRQGEGLLVVARPKNWVAIAAQLKVGGYGLADAAETSVTLLDAEKTLESFMRHGLPDSVLFHKHVGTLVRTLIARGRPATGLRIYGEMVEVLAEEGNFHAAERLEELWNELAVRHAFMLLCGYSSAHFTSRQSREALTGICRAHSRVHSEPVDPLAEWLLADENLPKRDDRELLPS